MGALFFYAQLSLAQNWKDPHWLKLLHYNETLLGYKSEADGLDFFLSSEGKSSPKLELKAFLVALAKDHPDEKKNAYCRFPARVRWLEKQTSRKWISKVPCQDLNKFRGRMAAKSVAVVFSSYYLGNPASSFGHTFIRLGKNESSVNDDRTATELLDTGINYGAVTGNAGPLLYSLGGLTGIFNGTFNAIPYYYKVREYNDFETRDLWSYQLSFTQEEIDLTVDHIWELGHTYFHYFFLSENCSYHALTILEAVRPSLDLRQHLPASNTIPSTTLRALDHEGLIKKVSFRAAPSTAFYHQLSLLAPKEQREVMALVYDQRPIGEHPPERAALILDTALSLVDYKYAKVILKGDEKAQEVKRPILIARSKIPVRSTDLDYTETLKSAPHLGHGQRRLALSGLSRDGKRYLDLEYRFAFHDTLDFAIGYPPRTKIEVGKFNLRSDGKHVQLREVDLVDVSSLGRFDQFTRAGSWKMKLGQWQTRRHSQDLSTQGFSGGYGLSLQWKRVSPYALAHGEVGYVSEELKQFKVAYGADAGLLFDLTDALKFVTFLEWRVHPWDDSRYVNELRFSNKDYGVGFFHQSYLKDGVQDLAGRVFFYF